MTETEVLEIRREIEHYNAMPCVFEDFMDLPRMADGDITLLCTAKNPAIPEKKWVPAYNFMIQRDGRQAGDINLRIGYSEGLYYGGQIGYNVDIGCRGQGIAGRACRLLIPVMRFHGMTEVLITNNVTNAPSRRVCEKLGARLLRQAPVPAWHDLYQGGVERVNVFAWSLDSADTASDHP